MLSSSSNRSNILNTPNTPNTPKIPKIIMQEWIDLTGKNKPYPAKWASSVESIKNLMPNWTHIILDNDIEKYVLTKFSDSYQRIYRNLEYPIMKIDMLRYMWLYLYGGIYMDMDIELSKSLEDLFYDSADLYLVKSGNSKTIYTNSFLASQPRCEFWLKCLDEIGKPYKYWMVGKHLKVMGKTGPLMLSRVVDKYGLDYEIKILPNQQLMPCSVCDPKPCTKEGAYTIALEGSSWCGWDSILLNSCVCYWKPVLLFIFFLLLFSSLLYFLIIRP